MPRKSSVFRSLLALSSLILLAGSIVLLFLLILAGTFNKNPLNRIFFLQADTKGIPNAPQGITHWTLYNHCGTNANGLNADCRPNKAAYPLVPQENFNTHTNIPGDFFNYRNTFFYLSRFTFAFYLIDIFFAVCALFTGLAAICTGAGAFLSALLTAVTLFFTAFTASIMTACYVMGAKVFRQEGRFARVGVKAMAFTWTTVALLFLANIGFLASYLAHWRSNRGKTTTRCRHGIRERVGSMSGRRAGGYNEKVQFGADGVGDRRSDETSESQRRFMGDNVRDYARDPSDRTQTEPVTTRWRDTAGTTT